MQKNSKGTEVVDLLHQIFDPSVMILKKFPIYDNLKIDNPKKNCRLILSYF